MARSNETQYLKMARRYAERGDASNAVRIVVNTLRNNPRYIETQPEAIEFLASVLIPGFDEELAILETRHPAFGIRLRRALTQQGRVDLIRIYEKNFNAFCISRMKNHRFTDDWSNDVHYNDRNNENSAFSVVQSGLTVPREYASQPAASFVTRGACADTPAALSAFDQAILNIPRPQPEGSAKSSKSTRSSSHFERVCVRRSSPETPTDASNDDPRIILDFDDRIRNAQKNTLFTQTQTRFTSFAEEREKLKETTSKSGTSRKLGPQPSATERIAEVTHALSETPSVEPYHVRNPLRFRATPRQILVCVGLCLLCVFLLMTYQTLQPDIEKLALQNTSVAYILAAESGDTAHFSDDAIAQISTDEDWVQGYRLFLETWRAIHFDNALLPVMEPNAMPHVSPAYAAYIMGEIHNGHFQSIQTWFDKHREDTELWKTHSYFKTWIQAQLDEASGKLSAAANRYDKLLHSPLAPFARVQLAVLALRADDTDAEVRRIFLQRRSQDTADTPGDVPAMVKCATAILAPHADADVPVIPHLRAPYRTYCATGRMLSRMASNRFGASLQDRRDLDRLQREIDAAPRAHHFDNHILRAMIAAQLYLQNTTQAIAYYKKLDLPENHPRRAALRTSILKNAIQYGNLSAIHEISPNIPKNISIFTAARVLDTEHSDRIEIPKIAEQLLIYGSAKPQSNASMDEIYWLAYNGQYETALTRLRNWRKSHDETLEPLLLQAEILSLSGKHRAAADLLDNAVANGTPAASFIALSNAYRARANLPLAPNAVVLKFLTFSDYAAESARCEVLWRTQSPFATSCIRSLYKNKNTRTKAAWIMAHLPSPKAQPLGTAQDWEKANAEGMSFPGFHLAYARVLKKENRLREAAQQYANAILIDDTTASIDVIRELEQMFAGNARRYDGIKRFESLIARAEAKHFDPERLGEMHLSAARIYQPQLPSSDAKRHLSRALDLLGDRPDILIGFVRYYDAKDKPETAAKWRARLKKALENHETDAP